MAIRKALVTWRESHGISTTQVAAELGLVERSVWRWEHADESRGPSLAQVAALEARWPGLVAALGLTSKPLESGTEARE